MTAQDDRDPDRPPERLGSAPGGPDKQGEAPSAGTAVGGNGGASGSPGPRGLRGTELSEPGARGSGLPSRGDPRAALAPDRPEGPHADGADEREHAGRGAAGAGAPVPPDI